VVRRLYAREFSAARDISPRNPMQGGISPLANLFLRRFVILAALR